MTNVSTTTTSTSIIRDGSKLGIKITNFAKRSERESEVLQVLLASSIWRGIAHSDNSGADRLVRAVLPAMQQAVTDYLLAFGPFVVSDTGLNTKKGTKDNLPLADEIVAKLPLFATWKKEKATTAKKLPEISKEISRFISRMVKLEKEITDSKTLSSVLPDDDIAALTAMLSYRENISAGVTREKMLADTLTAHQKQWEQEKAQLLHERANLLASLADLNASVPEATIVPEVTEVTATRKRKAA